MSRGQGRCVGSSGEERLWQGTSPDISGARRIKPGISALIALSCDPAIVSAWPLGLLGKGRRAWMTRALTEQGWMRTQGVTSTQRKEAQEMLVSTEQGPATLSGLRFDRRAGGASWRSGSQSWGAAGIGQVKIKGRRDQPECCLWGRKWSEKEMAFQKL